MRNRVVVEQGDRAMYTCVKNVKEQRECLGFRRSAYVLSF